MSFAVQRTTGPDGVCIAVAGEVDIDTAPRMRTALAAAADTGSPVVIDLGAVTFMDSAGLAVLIATRQRSEALGVSVRLKRVPPAVLRLLALTGMDTLFAIEPEPVG